MGADRHAGLTADLLCTGPGPRPPPSILLKDAMRLYDGLPAPRRGTPVQSMLPKLCSARASCRLSPKVTMLCLLPPFSSRRLRKMLWVLVAMPPCRCHQLRRLPMKTRRASQASPPWTSTSRRATPPTSSRALWHPRTLLMKCPSRSHHRRLRTWSSPTLHQLRAMRS